MSIECRIAMVWAGRSNWVRFCLVWFGLVHFGLCMYVWVEFDNAVIALGFISNSTLWISKIDRMALNQTWLDMFMYVCEWVNECGFMFVRLIRAIRTGNRLHTRWQTNNGFANERFSRTIVQCNSYTRARWHVLNGKRETQSYKGRFQFLSFFLFGVTLRGPIWFVPINPPL